MSVISWGKPTLELAKLTDEEFEIAGTFTPLGDAAQGTTTLTTNEGGDVDALDEDGNPVDSRSDVNTYQFEAEIFIKKNDADPVPHIDGKVDGLYAFRLTPKDPACRGKYAPKCRIKVLDTWNAADGERARLLIKPLHSKDGFCVCNAHAVVGQDGKITSYTYTKSDGSTYTPTTAKPVVPAE